MNNNFYFSIISTLLLFMPASVMASEYFPIININYDTSQSLALEAGVVVGPEEGEGLTLSIEPSLAGTKYHVGYGRVTDAAVGAIAAYRISWTELQMYATSNDFTSGSHYSGIEYTYISTPVLVQLGVFRDPANNSGLFTIGFGMGI